MRFERGGWGEGACGEGGLCFSVGWLRWIGMQRWSAAGISLGVLLLSLIGTLTTE